MMVTFVSQCQKKALKRTRMILDAFANRIGDNVWQTVITEEGLITVKKLLRQSATKSTAVSCHWIRSRVRSELVWIVGNKSQFNEQGFVAVNSTQKGLFMDIPHNKPKENMTYANTHLQPLADHLFAVGYLAEMLHKKLIPHLETHQYEPTFIAGCLHDLGKIDPHFQEWVRNPKKQGYIADDGQHIDDKKFNFDKHPRHNEISVLLYQLFDHSDIKNINIENKKSIKHAIYWHHAKPFRKEGEFIKYRDIYKKFIKDLKISDILNNAFKLIEVVKKIECDYKSIGDSALFRSLNANFLENLEQSTENLDKDLPPYKFYEYEDDIEKYQSQILLNANNNIIRSCVIAADRLISSLTAEMLKEYVDEKKLDALIEEKETLLLESNLQSDIESCLKNFPRSDRTNKQQEIADQLAKISGIAVLSGPAGCGKTKIALEIK